MIVQIMIAAEIVTAITNLSLLLSYLLGAVSDGSTATANQRLSLPPNNWWVLISVVAQNIAASIPEPYIRVVTYYVPFTQ
jgi:hypothetical protein